jgi:uncharacterized protein (UPF0548 family)
MLFFRRPNARTIQLFLEEQSRHAFAYAAIGATAATVPSGYLVNHIRIHLGAGEKVFAAAKQALEQWQQFRLGWVETYPSNTPIAEGRVVAILARSLGLWWLNACRIVYVIDADSAVKRYGFAYGTLPDHMASGEERFLIEWDREQGSVWYDILAFSRPWHVLARLGYPWTRHVQRRFGRQSAAAMQGAVQAVA